MSSADKKEALPEAVPVTTPWEEAAVWLEQAGKLGKMTPELAYLLALAYKRQGKLGEARTALRKITAPDANVWLQLGLLSFREGHYAQAAEEFARSAQLDSQSYAAVYNLLLARLHAGDLDGCLQCLPQVLALARDAEERRFVELLQQLFHHWQQEEAAVQPPSSPAGSNGEARTAQQALAAMSTAEESRLLELLRGVSRFDAVYPLLQSLAAARPDSARVQQTFLEMVLVQARQQVDRCKWSEAEQLLAPLTRPVELGTLAGQALDPGQRLAFLNLQGVCACMLQDFERALQAFTLASQLEGNQAWICQNLALTHELMGRLDQAELHWNRYFDLLEQGSTARTPGDAEMLAYTGLARLVDLFSRQERWSSALAYMQRAARLRPRDVETLERLFHLYVQVRRPEDARRTLRKLRELQPTEPQFDLYELDLRELRTLEDIDRMLSDIKRIVNKYPGEIRVDERAVNMVVGFLPLVERKCNQLSDKLAHIVEQVRRLPNYQINWPVVHDEMHYLRHEFQKLRRLCSKCLSLVSLDEHRRVIRELNDLIDQKIDICVSMGG
jgi:Flp pilus assembly protein TadD